VSNRQGGILARLPRLSIGQATLAWIGVDGALAIGTILTTPYVVHRLGTEPYGILAMVSVLAGQLGVLHLGVGPAATRRIAEARGQGESETHTAVLWATALLSLGAALLVGSAFLVVAPWAWTHRFKSSDAVAAQALAAMVPSAIVVGAQPLLAAVSGGLAGEERFGALNVWRLVYGLGRMAAAVATVSAGGGTREVLWAQAAVDGTAIVIGFAAWPALRRSVSTTHLRLALSGLLAVGIPFAGAGLLASLLVDAEKLAVSMARSIADFTYYTVPFNAVFRLTMFAGALSNVLFPRLASVAAAGDRTGACALVQRGTRLSMAAMAFVLAPLIAIAPELLGLWLGPSFSERSTRPVRILLVALLANTASYAYNAAIRARARPAVLTGLYAAELPLHLVTVFLMVRAWGITGAALAWGVRALIDLAGHHFLTSRAFGLPVGGRAAMSSALTALAAFAFSCELFRATMPAGPRVAAGIALGTAIAFLVLKAEDRVVALRALDPGALLRGGGA
jgi:O-antigen/teichoic acid export membrane protein